MIIAPLERPEKTTSLPKKLVRAAALRYIGGKLVHMSGDFRSTSKDGTLHVRGKRHASTTKLTLTNYLRSAWETQTRVDTLAITTDPNASRRVTGLTLERYAFGSNEDIGVQPAVQTFDLREQQNDLGLLDVVKAVRVAAQQAVYLRPGDN